MVKEFQIEMIYKVDMREASVSAAELALIESMLPELVLLAQRSDDREDD